MEICRICLEYKNNLCSVLKCDQRVSLADMLKSVVNNVKIDAKHKVCLQCRRKLRNLYDFKKQVERSDILINKYLNVIHFDNIDDVKAMLVTESENKENIKRSNTIESVENLCNLLINGSESVIYKNITIKKVNSIDSIRKIDKDNKEPLSASDTIKLKNNNDAIYKDEKVELCDGGEYELHKYNNKKFDYKVIKQKKVSRKTRMEKKTVTIKGISGIKRVCIKPIVMNYLKKLSSRKKINNNKVRKKKCDICPHCGIMTAHLKSHILQHTGERKYKCPDCHKTYLTKGQLNYHQKKHLTDSVFKCDNCLAVFNTKASLKSHMIIHIDVKNHVCAGCNKSFKRKNALERHKLIHISSAKSFKCEWCNMSFLSKVGLKHHMRVHTGERPYKCEICVQPYSYKHDFNKHCLKKHGVFLKQRSINVMNEEMLMQERALMKNLMLRFQGVVKKGEPLNPFSGPQAALAFKQAVKDLANRS